MHQLPIRIETGTGAAGLHVTIVDHASGKLIVKFTLDHAAAAHFMMGSVTTDTFPAEVIDARQAAYLGKKCYTYVRTFRTADRDIRDALRDGDDTPDLNLWADVMRSQCWAQSSSWGLRNQNRVVFTMRRYCNELTGEQHAGIGLLLAEATPPRGLVAE